ncbi:hypothetical protein [Dyadobacter fanqingshengii]|uniref:Nucleotidyltransferase family protein n=1 Tax=Dyadobacter fanqingshengii TaxID=2906443 RepID=A0A9X1P6Q4_9BACT|nr:hypothetical protein [Dyadobacter fanqingshengii]MCF0039924.1 hypothetical protein [Dyadobacter fanqingshengii]USJ38318.1 hypothetical protein NFI81_11145 [Dyadobacter fanqingshengii]
MILFFDKIIDVLNSKDIPYMLSGSVAMSLYIVPRATRDFDFVIHLLPKDVDVFASNFQDGYYCNKESVMEAAVNHGMFNIIDHQSGYKADFIVLKNDTFRKHEFERKTKLDYFGKSIYVVTPEDLLISKLIWIQDLQSGIQSEDIRNLSELKSLDWAYIKRWIYTLNLKTFNLLRHE